MAKQVILNNGVMQRLLTIPDEGLLVRLHVDGKRLTASFEEGEEGAVPSSTAALQIITWALENNHLQIEPILDPENPFGAYNPGVVCGTSR